MIKNVKQFSDVYIIAYTFNIAYVLMIYKTVTRLFKDHGSERGEFYISIQ